MVKAGNDPYSMAIIWDHDIMDYPQHTESHAFLKSRKHSS